MRKYEVNLSGDIIGLTIGLSFIFLINATFLAFYIASDRNSNQCKPEIETVRTTRK